MKKLDHKYVTAVRADASSLVDLETLYSVIQKQKGRLDIVFANAGIGLTVPLDSITEKDFDHVINVNVKGVLFTVQKALPLLVDGGSIILNGSIASTKGLANTSIYSATKAAIRSFARSWTVDLKERKIRVNALSPGPINTTMLKNFGNNEEEHRAALDYLKAATALDRIGEAEEIAKAVVFLASSDSSYVTGIELFVDGGLAQT